MRKTVQFITEPNEKTIKGQNQIQTNNTNRETRHYLINRRL